eukprot:m.1373668 g.1373668  ORF g.1373668 m.1373668 type:complete len:285 (-) comp24956_c0_seq7:1778-2632(-)
MHRVASRFACEGCPTTDEIRSHDHNERGLRVCDCIPIAINLLPCELRTHSNLREIHGLVEILHLVTIAFVCFCSIHWYSFSSVWGICVARYRLDAEDAYTCRSWEKALKEPNGKKPQATAAGPVIPRYIAGESDESDGDGLYEEPSDNDAGPSRSAHTGGKSAESDRLEAQWWYAGALGRVEAEQRVTAWGGQRGTFLVRESSQRSPAGTKGYVLTLCGAMGAPITHSLLLVSTTDGACIYKTKATTAKTGFPSVQSLVAHFQAEPFPDGTLLLSAAPPGATGG